MGGSRTTQRIRVGAEWRKLCIRCLDATRSGHPGLATVPSIRGSKRIRTRVRRQAVGMETARCRSMIGRNALNPAVLALVLLLAAHGLIHSIGFLKAYGFAALPQLHDPISRVLG